MIPHGEIRLGNWHYDNTFKEPFPQRKMTMGFWCDMSINVMYLSDLEPIPLTPRILEKCGFKEGSYHKNWFSIPTLTPHIVKYDDGFILEMVDDIRISESFQYLHQLQNLYFALTGTELNYTP